MGKRKKGAKKPRVAPQRKPARKTPQNTKVEEEKQELQEPEVPSEDMQALHAQLADAQKKLVSMQKKMKDLENDSEGRPILWHFPVVDGDLKKSDQAGSSNNGDNKNDLDPDAGTEKEAEKPGEKQEDTAKFGVQVQGKKRWSRSARDMVPVKKVKDDSQGESSSQ